ncbi:MAG: hypothetical protein ACJ8AO_11165 [Gemmatimonadaceae bacterium]
MRMPQVQTGADAAASIIGALAGGAAGVVQTALLVRERRLAEERAAEERVMRARAEQRQVDETTYKRGQDRLTRERQEAVDRANAERQQRELEFKEADQARADARFHAEGGVDAHGRGAAAEPLGPGEAGRTFYDPALSAKARHEKAERGRRVSALVKAYPHVPRERFEAHLDDPAALRRLAGLQTGASADDDEGGATFVYGGAGGGKAAKGALDLKKEGAASLGRQANEAQQDVSAARGASAAARKELDAASDPALLEDALTHEDSAAVTTRRAGAKAAADSAATREGQLDRRYGAFRHSADSAEADVQAFVQKLMGGGSPTAAAAPAAAGAPGGARQVINPFRTDPAASMAPVPLAMQKELDAIGQAAATLKARGVPDSAIVQATADDVAAVVGKYGYRGSTGRPASAPSTEHLVDGALKIIREGRGTLEQLEAHPDVPPEVKVEVRRRLAAGGSH